MNSLAQLNIDYSVLNLKHRSFLLPVFYRFLFMHWTILVVYPFFSICWNTFQKAFSWSATNSAAKYSNSLNVNLEKAWVIVGIIKVHHFTFLSPLLLPTSNFLCCPLLSLFSSPQLSNLTMCSSLTFLFFATLISCLFVLDLIASIWLCTLKDRKD